MKIPVDYMTSESFFGLDIILLITKRHYPELNFAPPANVEWRLSPHPLFTSNVQKATSILFREVKGTYEQEFDRIFKATDNRKSFVHFLNEEGFRYWLKSNPLTHEIFIKACIRYAIFTAKAYSIGITTAPSIMHIHVSNMIKRLRKNGCITEQFWETLQASCNNYVRLANLYLIFICALIVLLLFYMYSTQWFHHDMYLDIMGIFVTVISTYLFSRTVSLYCVMENDILKKKNIFIFPMDVPADYKSSESFFGLDIVFYIMKRHYPKLNFTPPVNLDWGLSPHPHFTSDVQKATSMLFKEVKNTYEKEFYTIFTASSNKLSFVNVLIEEGFRYWSKKLPLTAETFMRTCIRYAIFTAKAYSMGITTAPGWTHLHVSEMIKKSRKVGYITDKFWKTFQTYCTNCAMQVHLLHMNLICNCVLIVFLTFFMYLTEWFHHDVYLDIWGIFVIVLSIKFLSKTVWLYYMMQKHALLKKIKNIFIFPINTFYPVTYVYIYCIFLLSITPLFWYVNIDA